MSIFKMQLQNMASQYLEIFIIIKFLLGMFSPPWMRQHFKRHALLKL